MRKARLFRNGRNQALRIPREIELDADVAKLIIKAGEDLICTNIVVVAELRYGATKSNSVKLADRINLILSALEILPLPSRCTPYS